VVADLTGDEQFARWMNQIVPRIAECMLGAILGHPVGPNVQIAFAHPAPESADVLVRAFDGRVVFGAPETAISVPAAWRRLPSPLYDDVMYRDNISKCREIIAQRESRGSVGSAVRCLLASHFDAQLLDRAAIVPPPGLEDVASALHVTSRTLIRRLASENTAFREILEQLRQEMATRLLANAQFTVAEISELLGYREPANFGRAFRRWFGTSPAAWRRQAAGRVPI
jgi:AraC-like DNA-binding protein